MKDYKRELTEQVNTLDELIKKAEKRLKANPGFKEELFVDETSFAEISSKKGIVSI